MMKTTGTQIRQWMRIIFPALAYLGLRMLMRALPGVLPHPIQGIAAATLLLALFAFLYQKQSGRLTVKPESHISLILLYAVTGTAAGFLVSRIAVQHLSAGIRAYESVWTVCLLAPCCEEIVFRGLVYDAAESGSSETTAVIISTLLFAAGHSTLPQMLWAIPVGTGLGLIRKKESGPLIPAMVHCMINLGAWIA